MTPYGELILKAFFLSRMLESVNPKAILSNHWAPISTPGTIDSNLDALTEASLGESRKSILENEPLLKPTNQSRVSKGF